jgi:hypothetical protein
MDDSGACKTDLLNSSDEFVVPRYYQCGRSVQCCNVAEYSVVVTLLNIVWL